MADSESSALPDTPIEPLTISRIEEILTSEGIEYRTDEIPGPEDTTRTVVHTGYRNSALTFVHDADVLICDSIWRGELDVAEAPSVLAAVSNWNQMRITPTLRFFEQHGSNLVISAYRQLYVGEGVSRNQLGGFILSSLAAILEAYASLEDRFPDAVTWRYEE
ncbi:YbjN domain-containing protein [Corynebacterium uterequi]|uniref:Putative bacterial sensory transduction regulator n=1 Tax=Corynebacterium uterequi TaxID=1072256 RepID=A0A0G3HCV8_9CORY|nr:YbjN domain-containing protein [Corynebacterium uterequi]AKK11196.1 Putative bacterial sensory transduction regulator [Corynebacterium uterequi]